MQEKDIQNNSLLSNEQQAVEQFLNQLTFRKTLFGADREEVWQAISDLNGLYEKMLLAERARYESIISQLQTAQQTGGNTDEN